MPGSINRERVPISNHKTNLDTILLDAMDGLEVREAQKTLFFWQFHKAAEMLTVCYSRQANNLMVFSGLSSLWAFMGQGMTDKHLSLVDVIQIHP